MNRADQTTRRSDRVPATKGRGVARIRPRPRAGAVGAAALLALAALLLGACGGDEENVRSLGPGPHPEQRFFDYRLVESQDGIKQWVLESDEMQKFPGDPTIHLVDLRLQFYRDGEFFSTLVADSGRAHATTRDLYAWGDVVVVTEDGRRLETQELYYDNERDIIHNEVFDRLTRGEDVVTGVGLEATPDLEYIEIKQRVQAEVGDAETQEGESP